MKKPSTKKKKSKDCFVKKTYTEIICERKKFGGELKRKQLIIHELEIINNYLRILILQKFIIANRENPICKAIMFHQVLYLFLIRDELKKMRRVFRTPARKVELFLKENIGEKNVIKKVI